MKIYTKTGDDGTTGLFGGARVTKESSRIEAYGTVDELNALVGSSRAALTALRPCEDLDQSLARIQAELFTLGAELATPPSAAAALASGRIGPTEVERLEREIDGFETELEPLRCFILPGGSAAAAALHVARTVCRRAERMVVRLGREEPVPDHPLIYLNRLSDHLFVLARVANRRAGLPDVPWRPRG